GGEVVADAGLVETPWGTRLQEVQVRRDWRGKGVGTELLRGLGALAARRWPGRPLLLEAEADNPAALALYRKVGFREVERTGSAFRRPGST
ncbi:MAG: N-acetyltransferase, partial [Myxococcota bacterium]